MKNKKKEKLYLLVVNNNSYEVNKKVLNNALKLANDEMKKRAKYYIYCVSRNNIYIMEKATFKTLEQLHEMQESFYLKGFKVYKSKVNIKEEFKNGSKK